MKNGIKRRVFNCFAVSFLLMACSVCQAGFSFLADTVQEVYSIESQIPVTQANMVLQTRDGYLWVASYDGLVRYDGNHSTIFNSVEDGFSTRSIMTLFEDNHERLWIGSNNSGVALYSKTGGFRFFGTADGLPSNSIRKIVQDKRGTVFVATTLGLAAIDRDFTVRTVTLPGYDSLIITDMFVSMKDELWCVLNDGAVLVLANQAVLKSFPPRFFTDAVTQSVYQTADGAIYLGFTDNRVVVIGAGDAHTVHSTGPRKFVNSFYEDGLGRVWVCADNGVGFFLRGKFQEAHGALIDNSIKNMTMDFEGNLWFASARKGLLQVMKSKFTNISMSSMLPSMVVNATLKDDGKLYIGNDRGLVILDQRGAPVVNNLTRHLQGIRVRSIARDDEGALWIATYSVYGLVRYGKDGNITSMNAQADGLASDTVRCVKTGSDGKILVGTANGLSIVKDGRVVKNYGKKEGLLNPVVMNIHEDAKGVIYLGSDGGGIYVIDGDRVSSITEADGLPSGIIMRFRYDPALDGLWVSTENSVCFWDGEKVRNIGKLGGYGINVFDFQFAGDDAIWLLGSGGVFIVSRKNLLSDEPLEAEVLNERDGLRNTITANSWNYLDDSRTLFLCTNEGVLSIAMDTVYKNTVPPRLIISRATIDDKNYDHPAELHIPPDAMRVTIHFSLISFIYPTGNKVTFFMKGIDKEPVTASTDRMTSVSYTNLAPGNRSFVISGRNREGVPSREIVLPVVKTPDFWETPLARIGLGVSALAACFLCSVAYNRYKTRAILKREQEYREITEQAVTAIADTIDAKDRYTHGHSKRVAEYSRLIAKRLRLPSREIEDLYYTALLHDIGKIGLDDDILNKPGKLTDDEFGKMKQHVEIGGDILKSITVIKDISIGARYHHERYDGRGYCSGLSRKEIPLFARIICVADAYDAMTTTRSYRKQLDRSVAVEQLVTCKGTQFDAEIAEVMIDLIQSGDLDTKMSHAGP